MRSLAVKPHYAALILAGYKTIEVRSKPTTKLKERVAIYSSNHQPTSLEISTIKEMMGNFVRSGAFTPEERNEINILINNAPRGCILGTVEIVYSQPVGSDLYFDLYKMDHFAHSEYYKEDTTYFWGLKRPVKFDVPIPVKWHTKGSWANIELPEEYK